MVNGLCLQLGCHKGSIVAPLAQVDVITEAVRRNVHPATSQKAAAEARPSAPRRATLPPSLPPSPPLLPLLPLPLPLPLRAARALARCQPVACGELPASAGALRSLRDSLYRESLFLFWEVYLSRNITTNLYISVWRTVWGSQRRCSSPAPALSAPSVETLQSLLGLWPWPSARLAHPTCSPGMQKGPRAQLQLGRQSTQTCRQGVGIRNHLSVFHWSFLFLQGHLRNLLCNTSR